MDVFLSEWIGVNPDWRATSRLTVKMFAALLVGAIIGAQRERVGKPAGLRTHILVALGTATVVIAGLEYGMESDAISRVIQGVVTGIGFLGAGTILKLEDERLIKGLTTAASIWMTAALAIGIGLGQFTLALVGALFTWIVLAVFMRIEDRIGGAEKKEEDRQRDRS